MSEEPAAIRVEELGHVTLFVRDVEAAARFYRDVLGLIDRGRGKNGRIAFFSAGRHHHDLACQAVGPDAPAPTPGAPGLPVFGEWRTESSHSISTRDPDGHEMELYVELGPS